MKSLSDWPLPPELQNKIANLRGARRKSFVIEYVRDRNASRAAAAAGYSIKAAGQHGSDLLKKPEIVECIEAVDAWRRKLLVMEGEEIIQEFSRVAAGRITDVASWDGDTVTLKPSAELTDNQIAAIAEVQQTKEGVRIKMHPKLPALEALARHFGLFDGDHSKTPLEEKLSQLVDVFIERMKRVPNRSEPYAVRPLVPIDHESPK